MNSDVNAPPSGTPRWMMSFADLMSVILTFFVLLFSMSKPPEKVYPEKNSFPSTNEAEGKFSVHKTRNPSDISVSREDQDLSVNYLSDILRGKIGNQPELSKLKMIPLSDRLILTFNTPEFNDEAALALAKTLKDVNNKTAIYTSSLDQSHNIVEKLQENGMNKEVSFVESPDSQGKIDIVIYP